MDRSGQVPATATTVVDPILNRAQDSLNAAGRRIAELTVTLRELADDLLGPSIEGEGKDALPPQPSGRANVALDSIYLLHDALTHLEAQVQRLSAL